MSLNELRLCVLSHREDIRAFHAYIDRSKSEGSMITINPNKEVWLLLTPMMKIGKKNFKRQ